MRYLFLLVLALLGSTASPSPAATSGGFPLSEVRRAVDAGNARYLAALKRADAKAFAALYAPDGMQIPSSGQPIVRGRSAIFAQTQSDAKQFLYTGGGITTTNLAVSGNDAFESGRYWFSIREKGKPPSKISGRYFVVWTRQPSGAWLIASDSGFADPAHPCSHGALAP